MSDDKIVKFAAPWFGKIPVDQVLDAAKGKLESVVIIGVEKGTSKDDQVIRYYASSDQITLEGCVYEMELFKHKILHGDFG